MLITVKPPPSTWTASAAACTVSACGVSETRVRGIDPAGTAGIWGSTLPSVEAHWASGCRYDENAVGRLIVTNLRLPGQYDERLLGSLGLQGPYYNWNRWYLPGVGRYLEPDPIALEGEFNSPFGVDWYSYAGGNPLSHVDPNGESWADFFNCALNPTQCWKVDTCAVEAREWTTTKFGWAPAHNNDADAFRHCYWSCCMARELGSDASKRWGDGHEDEDNNPVCEKHMDQYNNFVGRQLAWEHPGQSCDVVCTATRDLQTDIHTGLGPDNCDNTCDARHDNPYIDYRPH